jgi:division protein CdvB (Snf7/Vps24/ESCRT-III family)
MWIGRHAWNLLNRNIGELTASVQTQSYAFHQLRQGVNRMTQAMDDLNAAIADLATAVSTEIAGINDEITKLKMQGPSGTPEDTAGIEAGVAKIQALVQTLAGATPAPAAAAPSPSPTPAPGPTPSPAPDAPTGA